MQPYVRGPLRESTPLAGDPNGSSYEISLEDFTKGFSKDSFGMSLGGSVTKTPLKCPLEAPPQESPQKVDTGSL